MCEHKNEGCTHKLFCLLHMFTYKPTILKISPENSGHSKSLEATKKQTIYYQLQCHYFKVGYSKRGETLLCLLLYTQSIRK